MPLLKLAVKGWFRSAVEGIDNVPAVGGALLVSNHSGGLLAMDVPVIAVAFAERFGVERPLYTLAHDMLFVGPAKYLMDRAGFVKADRKTAAQVLRSGAVTIVFPGGDYDAYRPTAEANTIDFAGHTGYVRAALEADVPLVPVVSIGGQEVQLFLTRGEGLMERLGMAKLLRSKIAPITFGLPFGFTLGVPPNFPLPAKISTRVLEPIDIRAEFGDDPDIAEVDREVRKRMQTALDELAAARRFPVLG
ncbi:acyltransferase family protein [Aldersonia sp. NBC_00410]|uniref:lysophospholipid acyltransferase family protein n=1 Tax=Aldersonia sp. NBC_00410 TaxID=2975954 RepID=UPI00225ACED0|nr:lysophospholipid acyltransferase family protein [Aldersonia sp. NBC_00410]MCX5045324.1 acyltransferase family protein [Aldersonia sp. NBC_00410]